MYGTVEISNKNEFIRKVFLQMFLGLVVTTGVAIGVIRDEELRFFAAKYMKIIMIGEIALVLGLNFGINKISNGMAKLLFFAYSLMNGVTLSVVMMIYQPTSIIGILAITILIFVGMSIYGLTTKEDLTNYSGFFKGGLITLFIVSLINLFLGMPMIGWLISVFAVVLFTGLIAYDINRIVKVFENGNLSEEEYNKFSTIGALMLYLDFVNLFLHLLRLFGKKR